jgi:KRAB domain-containing zinc finger protein
MGSNVSLHVRYVHSGSKPYVCWTRQTGFRTKVALSRHIVIHEEEKRYACAVCGKRFSDKTNCARHQRTHTESVIQCGTCGRKFKKQSSLLVS